MTVAVMTPMFQRETSAVIVARTVGERAALARKGFRRDTTNPSNTWWFTAINALTPGTAYYANIGTGSVTTTALSATPLQVSETEWHAIVATARTGNPADPH